MNYQITETDEWFQVEDDEGVVAQFIDFEDARWYANEKPERDFEEATDDD